MHWVVLVGGILVVIGGMTSLSQATLGVGVVALGCFLGIVARLLQASTYQRQLMNAIAEQSKRA